MSQLDLDMVPKNLTLEFDFGRELDFGLKHGSALKNFVLDLASKIQDGLFQIT